MRFVHPLFLFAIPVVLLSAALSTALVSRRGRRLSRFASAGVLRAAGLGGSGWASTIGRVRQALFACGAVLIAVAAARPQWGRSDVKASARGASVLIALDVSRSMLAEDVRPNRLERAKTDLLDLVADLNGDRAGLLVFRGKGVMLCPLTTDYAFLNQAIDGVSVDSAPRGETDIADAIDKALQALESSGDDNCAIILISDGEDLAGRAREAAGRAAGRGTPIFTVGLGAADGSEIPDEDGGALKFGGQRVKTRLTESTLSEIASITGGAYIPLETSGTASTTLGAIYRKHLSRMARREYEEMIESRFVERFQLFLVPGLLMLLAAAALSRGRLASARKAGAAARAAQASVASLSMPLLFGLLLALAQQAESAQPESPRDSRAAFNKAVELYGAGDFSNAVRLLRPLMLRKDMPGAMDLYGAAEFILAEDPSVATNAAERMERLSSAAAAFQRVMAAGADDPARVERNIARAMAPMAGLREQMRRDSINAKYGKADPASLASMMRDEQRGVADAIGKVTGDASSRIEAMEELARREGAVADMHFKLSEMLAEAAKNSTNEEAKAAMAEMSETLSRAIGDAAEAIENISGDSARLAGSASLATLDIWKHLAEPPANIDEAILCMTNAFMKAGSPRWGTRRDSETALDMVNVFTAKFPQWAEEFLARQEQERQQSGATNEPPFTAETAAEIMRLVEPLAFILKDSAEFDDTPEKVAATASETLPMLEEIRSLLPKRESDSQGGQSQQQSQEGQDSSQEPKDGQEDGGKDEKQPRPDDAAAQKREESRGEEKNEARPLPEDVEEALRRALQRELEHEAEKQKLRREAPLPANSRDW